MEASDGDGNEDRERERAMTKGEKRGANNSRAEQSSQIKLARK